MKVSLLITLCLVFVVLQGYILKLPTEANNYDGVYDVDAPWASDRLTLKFAYAANENSKLNSSRAVVYWNGKVVHTIVPTDFLVKQYSVVVTAKHGSNNLSFAGSGV